MKSYYRLGFVMLPLLFISISCVPTFTNITVAPSYELIQTGQHDMTVLIKDYDSVLAVLSKWAERNKGKVATCSSLRYSGIGQTSPGCTTFQFEDFKVDIQLSPAINATGIHIIGRTESVLQANESISKELVTVFGQQAVLAPKKR
jgi:hypothetical protein